MLKDIIHIFILSCKRVSLLTEKQLYTKLSLIERVQLRLHLSLCKLCTCNKEKSAIIHEIITNRIKNIDNQASQFDKGEIEKIKLKLKELTCDEHNTHKQ